MNPLDALKAQVPLLLAGGIAFRFWLDLTVFPVELAQLLTVLWGGVFLAVGVSQLKGHPLRAPLLALTGWSLLSLVGAQPDALRHGLHLWIPLAWLLASEKAEPSWPRWVWVAAILPVGWSLLALAQGQPQEHVLHGIARLHGGYRNLHGHAVGMAALVSLGAWMALSERDRAWQALGGGMAALAGVALLFTWVRTLWIFVAVVVGLLLLLGRWTRTLGVGGLAAVAVAVGVPQVRSRLADVGSVLTMSAPEQGWGSIGSWRVRIWVESVAGFSEGPWWTWVVGRGLGGHVGLHKHLDPHNEYLSLVFQLGAVGLLLWGWLMLAALRVCWRAGKAGHLGVALIVAVLLTNGISNEWLSRATLQWVTFGAIGLAVRAGRAA